MLPVAGGVLMGLSAGGVLLLTGHLPGVSSLIAGIVGLDRHELGWRLAFVLGLVAGGAILALVNPAAIPAAVIPWPRAIVAAMLVGIGARLAGGCTSGHGLLGVGRLSWRSMVATITFMAAGMLTVVIARHVMGVLR